MIGVLINWGFEGMVELYARSKEWVVIVLETYFLRALFRLSN